MIASLAAAAALAAAPPQAGPMNFDLPAGPVLDGLERLSAQAEIDLVVGADLSGRRSPGLRGRMTLAQAFDRLLSPVGARSVRLAERAYRVEANPGPPTRVSSEAPPDPTPHELDAVIVTAPPRRGGLDGPSGRDPVPSPDRPGAGPRAGSEALSDLSASVDSTRQGTGRNKLFIRGLADSAFPGPLQATVGQYLGELRLTFGSPDPDLALVDIDRVEVFEGPQGSRFGSGSIGGVIQLQPAAPAPGEASARLELGAAATSGGRPGADATLVANLPLAGRTALRAAAWARREGGFLDNEIRGSRDGDGVDAAGLRLALRTVADAWTIDGSALVQSVAGDDAQTVSRDDMARDRRTAEPYESDVLLLGANASRRAGDLRLMIAAGLIRQGLDERFDASRGDGEPTVADRRQNARALTAEARIEHLTGGRWSGSGGLALLDARTRTLEELGQTGHDAAPQHRSEVRGGFTEAALFGEAVYRATDRLRISFGGRLAGWRASRRSSPGGKGSPTGDPDARSTAAFTPAFGVEWRRSADLILFGRFEQGVRPGADSLSRQGIEPLREDRVTLLEFGASRTSAAGDWRLEASAGYLDWRDIQADVVTLGGELVAANVGDGAIAFLQARGSWRPDPRLEVGASVFLNDSRLRLRGPGIIGVTGGEIPNVAPLGLQATIDHDAARLGGVRLTVGADLRYIGRSRPGLGPGLDQPQGGYLDSDLHARLGDERRALILRVSNPLNSTGIRYGVGSPYQLTEPQGAPLRPATVRLSLDLAF